MSTRLTLYVRTLVHDRSLCALLSGHFARHFEEASQESPERAEKNAKKYRGNLSLMNHHRNFALSSSMRGQPKERAISSRAC